MDKNDQLEREVNFKGTYCAKGHDGEASMIVKAFKSFYNYG